MGEAVRIHILILWPEASTLAPTGFWVGTSLGEKMAAFQRARANENSPELPPPVSLSPR